MAYLNIVSFDLGTTAWEFPSGTGTIEAGAARTGTHGLRCAKSGASTQSATFQGLASTGLLANFATTELFSTFWFNVRSMPGTQEEMLFKVLRSGGYKIYGNVTTDGKLSVYNSAGTLIQSTVAGRIEEGEWHVAQVRCESGASAIVQVYLDGDLVIDSINANTNVGAAIRLLLGQDADISGEDISVDYDDVAISEDAFPPIGAARIIRPNAAGTTTWQSNGAGATYLAVDESEPDGDTTFIYDQDGGLAHYENLESTASQGLFGLVHLVKPFCIARQEPDAQGYEMRLAYKSGGTAATTDADYGAATYAMLGVMLEADPDTSAAWTLAGVDAFLVGGITIDNGLSIGGMTDGSRITSLGAVVWHTAPGDREPKDPGGGGVPVAITTGTTALLSIIAAGTGRFGG